MRSSLPLKYTHPHRDRLRHPLAHHLLLLRHHPPVRRLHRLSCHPPCRACLRACLRVHLHRRPRPMPPLLWSPTSGVHATQHTTSGPTSARSRMSAAPNSQRASAHCLSASTPRHSARRHRFRHHRPHQVSHRHQSHPRRPPPRRRRPRPRRPCRPHQRPRPHRRQRRRGTWDRQRSC